MLPWAPVAGEVYRPGGVYHHVAWFAGEPVGAPVEASPQDEATADARSQSYQGQVVAVPARSEPGFGQGGRQGIVAHCHREPDGLLQLGSHRVADGPRKVGRPRHRARLVGQACDAQAHGLHRLRAAVPKGGHQSGQGGYQGRTVLDAGRPLPVDDSRRPGVDQQG